MKVAVIAIVRDEVSDILWWLGWYVSLGVDTIIVFDDGSKDGTDRIVADLSLIHISEPTRPVCSSRMPSSA